MERGNGAAMTGNIKAAPAVGPKGQVALVALSSPYDPDILAKGRQALAALGLTVPPGPDLTQADRYLAAPDARRAQALWDALTTPGVDAVLAARGGYGITRVLDLLEAQLPAYRGIAPRLVVGFSDVTALHLWLWTRLGWKSVHGPVCTSLGSEPDQAREHLRQVMQGTASGTVLRGSGLTRGVAQGRVVGGNLAVLMALAGTRYWPDLRGCVLLLEDVTELPHRLDRMLTQLLSITGGLAGVAGVALGHFTDCDDTKKGHTAQATLEERLAGLSIPVVRNLPVGHQAPNMALVHGGMVTLDASVGTLTLQEEAVVAAALT